MEVKLKGQGGHLPIETPEDVRCPRCGIDSVLPDSEGYPITEEFLKDMKREWFETIVNP